MRISPYGATCNSLSPGGVKTELSIFGGIIGIVFGVVVSYVISSAAGWNLYFSLWAILISIGFSSAVGIFFGWYPAAKAAALDPIEALAYE